MAPSAETSTGRAAAALLACFDAQLARGVPREHARRFLLLTAAEWVAPKIAAPELPGAAVTPTPDELETLKIIDQSDRDPGLLGGLYERSLATRARSAGGVHFTPDAEVARVIGPAIVAPWTEWIACTSSQAELRALHARLLRYTVLDPACGAGALLLAALRALIKIEEQLLARIEGPRPAGGVRVDQLRGIDVDPLAVAVADFTLRAASGGVGSARLQALDALIIVGSGDVPTWDECDVIVGNPPFLDGRRIARVFGVEYARRLRAAHPRISGRADYCVYWLRRAHDALPRWTAEDPVRGRAGLVATKTIRENDSRAGGLDHIVASGGVIVDAVSSQPWSGEAAVDVSIVHWVKGDYRGPRVLREYDEGGWREAEVETISSALTAGTDVSSAGALAAVTAHKRCFEGQQPGHKGFRLTLAQRRALAQRDPGLADVVFPYFIGDALLGGRYEAAPEFIIDFGERTLDEAAAHPEVLAIVEREVLPVWQGNARREGASGTASSEHRRRLATWWRLKRRRGEMLAAIAGLPRYIVCVRHTQRPIFVFLERAIRPDSALTVFAFADDYSFGVLQSSVHWRWFTARCSSLGRRFRYTSETVFDAFPWPQAPTREMVLVVATRARELRAARALALKDGRGGLRAVYRLLERPGDNPLQAAHRALDEAVLAAYGFAEGGDVLAQLLALHGRVAADADATGPGVPPGFPDPYKLVSGDCIAVHAGR
jgi:hypothetical protein